jgi:hypothetical protein
MGSWKEGRNATFDKSSVRSEIKRGILMSAMWQRKYRLFLVLGSFLTVILSIVAPGSAQQIQIGQTTAVDGTKMGAYRALAQLSVDAFQKGDIARAALLAQVLERTWDAAEGGGCDRSLAKMNRDMFEQIDKAMDVFIKPIIFYVEKSPDHAAVKAAYVNYLEKLKLAD